MPISSPPHPTTPALVAGTATPPACREADTPPKALVAELVAALEAAEPYLAAYAWTNTLAAPALKQARAAIATAHDFLGGRPAPRDRSS